MKKTIGQRGKDKVLRKRYGKKSTLTCSSCPNQIERTRTGKGGKATCFECKKKLMRERTNRYKIRHGIGTRSSTSKTT